MKTKKTPISKIHRALNKKFSQAWWHMPSTPALQRQKPMSLESEARSVYTESSRPVEWGGVVQMRPSLGNLKQVKGYFTIKKQS